MSQKESNSSKSRTRNYACIVYPESAPENWQQICSAGKVPVFISPLHDKDKTDDGKPKKNHHHVMVMYEGVKSPEQVKSFFESFGGVGCERVESIRGYARYLCHLDNNDKAQYSIEDVVSFGGADYRHIIGLPKDKYSAIREMMKFCNDNGNYNFADLLEYASLEREDWFTVLCDCGTYVMKEWCKSKNWKGGEV